MLKLVLIGYGRMGKAIEEVIKEENRGAAGNEAVEILYRIDETNKHLLEPEHLSKADAAIEFTNPESAVDNILKCFEAGVPVVSGTTGWLEKWGFVLEKCESSKCAFFYAPNFSIGVNLFFRLNLLLGKMMKTQDTYQIEMEEIHHTGKKDSPSGTALRLAEDLIEINPRLSGWKNEAVKEAHLLPIFSKRIEGVPGTHTVTYKSEIDDIEIKHTAHNRKGFASGAFKAAIWLHDKKGVYNMNDMLKDLLK